MHSIHRGLDQPQSPPNPITGANYNTAPCRCLYAGSVATTAWNLDRYAASPTQLLASLNPTQIPNDRGNSNLAAALYEVRVNVMSPSGGDRLAAPNVCVLLTASVATANTSGFLPEADLVRQNCRLIIIGIGNAVSVNQSINQSKPSLPLLGHRPPT